jgi:tight adherence protein C
VSSTPVDYFNFAKLLPLAIFGVVALAAWVALEMFGGKKTRATERLDELRNPNSRRRDEAAKGTKGDAMAKVFEKATPAFAKPLQPKNEFEANKLKAKLSAAGFRADSSSSVFLGFKFIGLIVGLAVFGPTMLAVSGATQKALVYTIFGAAMMFYLPDMVVGFIASKRKKSIFFSLPDVLDLMVVCVEAGLGLDQAMRKVSEEMKKTARVITEEFSLSNFQLQMGRQRSEVLHELGARTGVDDLRSFAAILIQADKFGSSVAQALRVQSDSMRTRRRQLAEEKAAKTAVKLIFPLVIFIFPGIFVVLVGPAAITMINQMFPAMGGH